MSDLVATGKETKAILRRWYDEMWAKGQVDLIPELAGPLYVRHEMGGTRTVTAEEYRDQTAAVLSQLSFHDLKYSLMAEGDKVCAIGSWRVRNIGAASEESLDARGPGDAARNDKQWDWVQVFRAEGGRLVETWLSGIGMESNWEDSVWRHLG